MNGNLLTMIGAWQEDAFDVGMPFVVFDLDFTNPLCTLWIELLGCAMLDVKIGTSSSDESITSTFDVTTAAVLHVVK